MTRWAHALADDIDPVVVDRLVAGLSVASYTSYERREAVRRLHAARLPKAAIAVRLRVGSRQVYRDLAALNVPLLYRRADLIAAARERRPVVARLAAAGVRTGEIARMLGCSDDVVAGDLTALGCPRADTRPLPRRPADELRRIYGHPLDEPREDAA